MAKDYAKGTYSAPPPKKRKAKKSAPARKPQVTKKPQKPIVLFGGFLLAGVLLGILIAVLVYLDHHKPNQPAHPTTSSPSTQEATVKKASKAHHHTQKSTEASRDPHFDFYTILPNKQVDEPKNAQNDATLNKPKNIEYILQVASVRKFQDADRLRAQLILLGYEVFISKSNSGKIAWHRVNLGPYSSLKSAEQKQDELRKNQINSILLKRTKNTA